ncbi:unnamed protein product [Rotaria sordida]|uniref:Uncharacterized protein n=1 Tax=Rotaria sordida TaxID=392033 RepID=A0A815UH20_9BILA|nr:unnamed protein product [Rotaria sordida]CAF4208538.1 unnamed protein product [Rotaria sordida]
MSALPIIINIIVDQWKQQSLKIIQFVIKQISKKIQQEDIKLIQDKKKISHFEIELKQILAIYFYNDSNKEYLNIIINILTKISMIFGKQPKIDQSLYHPFCLICLSNMVSTIKLLSI